MNRALVGVGKIAAACATCYLAYLTALLVAFDGPRLLLLAFSRVELLGFDPLWAFPNVVTRFPAEGSFGVYVVYHAGYALAGVAVMALGLVAVRRTRGWLRLFSAQAVLCSGVVVVLRTAPFVMGPAGPLAAIVGYLWPSAFRSVALRVAVGGITVGLLFFMGGQAQRGWLDATNDVRASCEPPARRRRLLDLMAAILAPAALVAFALETHFVRWWHFLGWRVVAAPAAAALLMGLIGLPAILAGAHAGSHSPKSPAAAAAASGSSLRGMKTVLGVFAGVVLLLILGNYIHGRSGVGGITSYRSHYWQIYIQHGRNSQADGPTVEADSTSQATTAWGARCDLRLSAEAGRLGIEIKDLSLRAFLYASTRAMLRSEGTDGAFVLRVAQREVHHLLAPEGDVTDPRGDARLLMGVVWGEAGSEEIAQGIARYAIGSFHGHALKEYAGRIAREESAYTLKDIWGWSGVYLSPLVRDALQGAWVEFVVGRHGTTVLRTLYQNPVDSGGEDRIARVLGSTWPEMEHQWRDYLMGQAAAAPPPSAATPEKPTNVNVLPAFQRGISFSHEVGGNRGYGSDEAALELAKLRALGANAVAIVPYAFTRAPKETTILFETDERDDRVIRAIQQAHALGLWVMLKPQLWSGEGFPGNITFRADADFARWFDDYRRWMLHYARMAQLYSVELLAVGTELGGLTPRESAWRDLIRDVRRIYPGPLTYAAQWGREFEGLRFWDALDYLGLNMYYPLVAGNEPPRPDSPRVKELLQKLASLSRRWSKPVLFTEVGYPSVTTAAAEPWNEQGGPLDAERQRQCYEVIFQGFYRQPWFAGLYWWKWPSDGQGNRFDPSFSPVGKPAARVIARWYGGRLP